MLSVSETSPGKAKPADLILSVIFNPKNTTLPGDSSAEPQNDTCMVARNPIFVYVLPLKRERRLARDESVITLFLFGDAGFAKFDKVLDLHLSDISLRPVANGNFARSRFLLADYEHIRNTL